MRKTGARCTTDVARRVAWLPALQANGQHEEAVKLHGRAVDIRNKVLGLHHPDSAINYIQMAQSLQELGRMQEGRECLELALSIRIKTLGETVRLTWSNILPPASSFFNIFLAWLGYLCDAAGTPQSQGITHTVDVLAGICTGVCEVLPKAAFHPYRASTERSAGFRWRLQDQLVGMTWYTLGFFQKKSGNRKEAIKAFQKAADIWDVKLGANSRKTRSAKQELSALLAMG